MSACVASASALQLPCSQELQRQPSQEALMQPALQPTYVPFFLGNRSQASAGQSQEQQQPRDDTQSLQHRLLLHSLSQKVALQHMVESLQGAVVALRQQIEQAGLQVQVQVDDSLLESAALHGTSDSGEHLGLAETSPTSCPVSSYRRQIGKAGLSTGGALGSGMHEQLLAHDSMQDSQLDEVKQQLQQQRDDYALLYDEHQQLVRQQEVMQAELAAAHAGSYDAAIIDAGTPAARLLRMINDLVDGGTPALSELLALRSLLVDSRDIYKPLGVNRQLLESKALDADVGMSLANLLGDRSTMAASIKEEPSTYLEDGPQRLSPSFRLRGKGAGKASGMGPRHAPLPEEQEEEEASHAASCAPQQLLSTQQGASPSTADAAASSASASKSVPQHSSSCTASGAHGASASAASEAGSHGAAAADDSVFVDLQSALVALMRTSSMTHPRERGKGEPLCGKEPCAPSPLGSSTSTTTSTSACTSPRCMGYFYPPNRAVPCSSDGHTAAPAECPTAAAATATAGPRRRAAAGAAALEVAGEAAVVGRAPPPPILDEVERILVTAEGWQWDAFALADATGGRPLSTLAYYLFHRASLLQAFSIRGEVLARFLRRIEDGYQANPYHNSTHAADVLQTLGVQLHRAGLAPGYADPLHMMACYTAAILHDFDHGGVNNDFLISSHDPLATTYNDRSPLENHHLAAGFAILRTPRYNFLERLPKPESDKFRRTVIDLVLATDMKQHFSTLSHFTTVHHVSNASNASSMARLSSDPLSGDHASGSRRRLSLAGASSAVNTVAAEPHHTTLQPLDETERLLALQMALKCADLGHTMATLPVHRRWVAALEEEFFRQGDLERAQGLPLSPLFDRDKQGITKSQVGFYDVVVLPLFRAFAKVFGQARPLLAHALHNYAHWKEVASASAASAGLAPALRGMSPRSTGHASASSSSVLVGTIASDGRAGVLAAAHAAAYAGSVAAAAPGERAGG